MPQFDVYRNPRGGAYPYLLDVQAEMLARLSTRVVVPMTKLKRSGPKPITRLNPMVRLEGADYVLVFQELAAIPRSALGDVVTSLAPQRDELVAAIDLLFTGI
jgi:toxin CcdB